MKYQGSCHCGQVAFEVEGDMGDVLACNCSICQRKGSLLWFIPRTALTLKTPEDKLASYTFNKHVIQHRFCPNCGIHPFGEGAAPNGDKMAAVNVRCLEGIDIESLKVQHYNGRDI
jgi:hypothetical protein